MTYHNQFIYIMPEEMAFGRSIRSVATTVGSGIAITLWDPITKVGGMCHSRLPYRLSPIKKDLSVQYVDEAIGVLRMEATKLNIKPKHFIVDVYGAAQRNSSAMPTVYADEFSCNDLSSCSYIARRNKETALRELKKYGFVINHLDVGGDYERSLFLDLDSGYISVKYLGKDDCAYNGRSAA